MEHALHLDGLLGDIARWALPQGRSMTTEETRDRELDRILRGLQRDRREAERTTAWRQLVEWLRQHQLPRLMARIRHRGRDLDPMAVLHEVYLGLFEAPPVEPAKLRLEFRVMDACRRVRRCDRGHERERVGLDTVAETLAAPERRDAPAPEAAAVVSDHRRELAELIEGLPSDRHREVARLRYLEGLELKQIAARLDMPLGTVKSDLNREIKPRLERGQRERSWTARVRRERA